MVAQCVFNHRAIPLLEKVQALLHSATTLLYLHIPQQTTMKIHQYLVYFFPAVHHKSYLFLKIHTNTLSLRGIIWVATRSQKLYLHILKLNVLLLYF